MFIQRQVTIHHSRLIVRRDSLNATKTDVGNTANWKKTWSTLTNEP